MNFLLLGRWLAAAVLLGAPLAAAQDAPPHDPVDDAIIRIGRIGISPAVVIRDVGRDDNVFNDPQNPKQDFAATISPKAEVLYHPGPLLVTYTTSTDYVYYRTYASERGTNVGSTLRLDFDFGPVKPYASVGGANTRDRFNREIDARARHRDRTYAGGVKIEIFQAVFGTLGGRHSTTTFDSNASFRGQSLARSLNETSEAIEGGLGVAVTPLTNVLVVVTRQRDRFELAPERDSETLRIMPTVTFSPLAILSGSAAFGYRRFTTASAAVPDYRGFVATVTLGTTLLDRHRIETVFSRDLQYSYEQSASVYLETGVQGTWTWQVVGPVDVKLNGSRSQLQYRSPGLTAGNDEDTATSYGLGAGYRVKERFRIGITADWRQRASERSVDRTFHNRRIYANLTWGKQ